MPPKDQCQEHGEAIVEVRTRLLGVEREMASMKTVVDGLQRVVGRLGLAWWIIAGLLAFGGSIAGNVVAAAIAAHK